MTATNKTILIIDDNIDFQFMATIMLKTNGYNIKSQTTGQIEAAVSSAKSCDIILLDIQLPGSSGIELGNALKSSEETNAIPIILFSGNCECDTLFPESRANAFLQKPFSLAQLMDKIREVLVVAAA
jgi:CheY-like chemotaxis protein